MIYELVVQYVKALTFIIIVTTMSVSIADDGSEDSYETKILYMVSQEVQSAMVKLARIIDDCRNQESNLNTSLFEKLEIPFEDLTTALFYLSNKARRECEHDEPWKNFSYSLSKFRSIQRHYSKKEEKIVEFENLIHGNTWREMKLELQYNDIDSKFRSILENIPELSKPYDPISIITKLEKLTKN